MITKLLNFEMLLYSNLKYILVSFNVEEIRVFVAWSAYHFSLTLSDKPENFINNIYKYLLEVIFDSFYCMYL